MVDACAGRARVAQSASGRSASATPCTAEARTQRRAAGSSRRSRGSRPRRGGGGSRHSSVTARPGRTGRPGRWPPGPTRRRETAGTRGSRRRAITDSTTPTATASDELAAEQKQNARPAACRRNRQEHVDEQRADHEQLDGAAVEDEREVRAAVVEHHDLVDHRQLEVRVRIVDGDARVLREQHDEERSAAASEDRRVRPTPQVAQGSVPSASPNDARPRPGCRRWRARGRAPARRGRRRRPRGSRPCPRSSSRCRGPRPW